MALTWPTIPEPGTDDQSQTACLLQIKNVVEMLTKQRPGAPYTIARVFKQSLAPGAVNSTIMVQQLLDGDIWIDTGNNYLVKIWDKPTQVWVPIA